MSHLGLTSVRPFQLGLIPVCLIILQSAVAFEDLDRAIMRLGAEDYDEREAATEELGTLSAGYARVFLKLSSAIKDPEIRDRLGLAARKIFERQMGAKDERWLRLHGSLRISYQPHFLATFRGGEKEREPLGMAVCWVDSDGPSDNRLRIWDVITQIDGVKLGARDIDQLVKPGGAYELTVRRFADKALISERDYVTAEDSEFEELKIKVVAGWRSPHQVDQESARGVMTMLWQEFLEDYQNPQDGKYAALKSSGQR